MKKIVHFVLLLLILGVAVVFFVLDPGKTQLFPQCPFHAITGAYCPGCGSQRALHSLLHFNIAGVVSFNFLFLPAALLVLYHYVYSGLNQIFGWKLPNLLYKKQTPWIILTVVLVFWILRNLPWYPFSVLAPE